MHSRQEKICGSPRVKQRQQKGILCHKAPRNADQEGKGEIFFFLTHSAIYISFLIGNVTWLELLHKREVPSHIVFAFPLFPFHLSLERLLDQTKSSTR